MALEYDGCQVAGASNGWEALALVAHESPDLVLLDVMMPGISGLEVLRRLHLLYESLPVIMMSADMTSAIRRTAIHAGAIDVLEKPFDDTDSILKAIHVAIDRSHAEPHASGSTPCCGRESGD